ncbi:MAG TPA: hypothetical protein VGJ14_01145 [Sporichthyaceae bacterium]|jgi:hypothetical protein
MRASKKVKGAVLLTAGAALILGAPTVYADTNTGHNDGLLNGVQALNNVTLNVPINACGVGALLGGGSGTCSSAAGDDNGGASFGGRGGSGGDQGDVSSSRNKGLLNGLQVGNNLTANVPVNACGVGALLATAKGNCSSKAGDGNGGSGSSRGRSGRGGSGGDQGNVRTGRNDGLLDGAQVLNNVTLNVPVNVCGVGLLLAEGRGNCSSKAGDGNGGNVLGGRGRGGNGGDAGDVNSFDNHGLLSGLQLLNNLDANIPVTVCGLAVLGAADCRVHVDAGNRNGGDSGHRGWVGDEHSHNSHWTWHKHHNGDHESSVLPHTGAAGMALIPFGLALIAGGAALRRRVASQR